MKTTALINKVLAAESHRKVIESMQACNVSLIIDETTEIAVGKQACLLARLFDPVTNRVETFLYKIVEVPIVFQESNSFWFRRSIRRHNSVLSCLNEKQSDILIVFVIQPISHYPQHERIKTFLIEEDTETIVTQI